MDCYMVLNYISHRFMVYVNKPYTSTFNDFKDKVLLFIIYYNVRAREYLYILELSLVQGFFIFLKFFKIRVSRFYSFYFIYCMGMMVLLYILYARGDFLDFSVVEGFNRGDRMTADPSRPLRIGSSGRQQRREPGESRKTEAHRPSRLHHPCISRFSDISSLNQCLAHR